MILSILAEAALRSIALAAAVWLALRLFKVTSAEVQSLAWRLVLIASLAMPLLMQFRIDLPLLPAPQSPPVTAIAQAAPPATYTAPEAAPSMRPTVTPVLESPVLQAAATSTQPASSLSWRQISLAVYTLVLTALVLRFLLGLGLTIRMAMGSQPIREDWTKEYRVRTGARVPTPFTFASMILLPLEYVHWTAEKRRAVVAHEGSHVRHGDFYAHVLSTLNRSIFWFNPLSWWLQKKLSQLAETISDDAALAQFGDRAGYARMLLDISAQAHGTALGIAMANPSTIRSRVERVISETALAPKLSARRKLLVALSLVPLLGLCSVAGLKAAEPPQAAARQAIPDVTTLKLSIYQSGRILFGQDVGKVELSDPDVIKVTRNVGPDPNFVAPRAVFFLAWKIGHSTATFYDTKGAFLYRLELDVAEQPPGTILSPPQLSLVAKSDMRAWLEVTMTTVVEKAPSPDDRFVTELNLYDVQAQGNPVGNPLDHQRLAFARSEVCAKTRDAVLAMVRRYSDKSADTPAGADALIADLKSQGVGVSDRLIKGECLLQTPQVAVPDRGGLAPQRQGALPAPVRVASLTPTPIQMAQATQRPALAPDAAPQANAPMKIMVNIETKSGIYRVTTNKQTLTAYGLTFDGLIKTLFSNKSVPGIDELKQIVVGTKNGAPVHASDVADIVRVPAAQPQQQGSLPAPVRVASSAPTLVQTAQALLRPDAVTALANKGDPDAQTIIGLRYRDGGGMSANKVLAALWLGRAAEQGQAVAQSALGKLYEIGEGVPKNPATAVRWYEAASALGNRIAMHNLALAYFYGNGVPKDLTEAARWTERAATLGLTDAQVNLALMYMQGEGVPQSYKEAYKWTLIAAAQGDADSRTHAATLKPQLSAEDQAYGESSAAAFHAITPNTKANAIPKLSDLPNNNSAPSQQGALPAPVRVASLAPTPVQMAQAPQPRPGVDVTTVYRATPDSVPANPAQAALPSPIPMSMIIYRVQIPGAVSSAWNIFAKTDWLESWYGKGSTELREGGKISYRNGNVQGVVTQWAPSHVASYTWYVKDPTHKVADYPVIMVATFWPNGKAVELSVNIYAPIGGPESHQEQIGPGFNAMTQKMARVLNVIEPTGPRKKW